MKRILNLTIIMGALLASRAAFGQQQVMFSQYMFNAIAINPAYVGSSEAISVTALTRHQWIGVDGAPSTQTLSAHSPIHKKNIAVGVLMMHDQIGVTKQNVGFGFFSYRIKFPKRGTLSMGLNLGFSNFTSRNSSVVTGTGNDPTFISDDIRGISPNFGTGVFYNTDRLYVGASAPFLLNTFYGEAGNIGSIEQIRHYFVMAGYVFDLAPALKFKPNALFKAVDGAPLQMDLNANFLLDEVIWAGVSWRSFDSFDLLFEIQMSPSLRLGYAYDITTTNLRKVNSGTHEVMLNYVLSFSKNRVVTPRYF